MSTMTIGKPVAGGAAIPIDLKRAIHTRLLVSGTSGAGKSRSIRRLLEQTFGQIQQIIIDREGEYATLREKFGYLLAGPGGECPVTVESAATLARRVLELQVSVIVDISGLSDDSDRNEDTEQDQYVAAFIGALNAAPRSLWHPVMVVIDEVELFCPEQGDTGAKRAIRGLCRQGRKRGHMAVLGTLRLSGLDKHAAAEMKNWLVGNTGLDTDIKRAAGIVGLSPATAAQTLRGLDPGQFFAYGPALCRTPTLIQVGPVVTTHPEPGEVAPPAPPPPAAIRKLADQLRSLDQEAKAELKEETDLRARISELEAALARAKAAPANQVVVGHTKEAVADALRQAREAGVREGCEAMARLAARQVDVRFRDLGRDMDAIQKALGRLVGLIGLVQAVEVTIAKFGETLHGPPLELNYEALQASGIRGFRVPVDKPVEPVKPRITMGAAAEAPRARTIGHRPKTQQAILDQLGFLELVGLREYETDQLALLVGASNTSSTWDGHVKATIDDGLVEKTRAGVVRLTDRGRAAAVVPNTPPTSDGIHSMIRGRLRGPVVPVFDQLVRRYPRAWSRDELAAAVGQSPTSSAYTEKLSELVTRGFAVYPDPGTVRAADALFVESDRRAA